MSHEDWLQPDELDALKAEFADRKTTTEKDASLSPQVSGYIPVYIPTPSTTTRWLYQSTVVRGLLLVLLGVVVGYSGQFFVPVPQDNTPIVRPVTETLEAFVARVSETLTADERMKLIAVTEKILNEHFDTPSAIREAFRDERLLADVDSDAFNAFNAKWAIQIESMCPTDTVEAMRSIYESLLQGLKARAYNDFTGGSVEAPFDSIIDSFATDEDEPNPPDIEGALAGTPVVEEETIKRTPLFRRR